MAVNSVQFARPEEISAWAPFIVDLLREFARPFLNMILIIMFFFFVVRPIINWLKREVEPAGSGAEQAVLPEYPSNGPSFGDGLPLPEAPQASLALGGISPETVGELDDQFEDLEAGEEQEQAYSDEQPEEAAPAQLAYGNLNRDNVLPLAKDNMERTVGLLRGWIEQKPEAEAQNQGKNV